MTTNELKSAAASIASMLGAVGKHYAGIYVEPAVAQDISDKLVWAVAEITRLTAENERLRRVSETLKREV